jgi:hypothetical protein
MTWYQPSCVAGSVSSDRFVRVVGQEPFLDAPLRWCIEGRLQWMHAKHPTNSKCVNNEVPVSHLQEAIGNPSAVNNTLIVDDPPSGPTSLSDPITSFIATAEEFVRRHKLNTLRPVLVPISCRHRSWMPSSAFVDAGGTYRAATILPSTGAFFDVACCFSFRFLFRCLLFPL